MKRSNERLRNGSEQRQDNQRHLALVERDALKRPKNSNQVNLLKKRITSDIASDAVLRDVANGDKRTCSECDCTNDKGFCDNYHLYAVMKGICRIPVKEAT